MNYTEYWKTPLGVEPFLLREFNREDNIILFEIGAAEGEDTIRYKNMFPNATIYAVEPLKRNYDKLLRNIREYDLQNVYAEQIALSDNSGTMDFFISAGHPSHLVNTEDWDWGNKSSSILPPTSNLPDWLKYEKATTITDTLENFCIRYNIDIIDYIHMDVQGAELMVLKGAKSYLEKIKMIWLEVSDIELYASQPLKSDVTSFLLDSGFEIVKNCSEEMGDMLFINKNIKK